MTHPDNPFLAIAAPGIAGLTPYVPGKPVSELERELGITGSIKLASNENPLGPATGRGRPSRPPWVSSGAIRTAAASSCAAATGRAPRGLARGASPSATAPTTCWTWWPGPSCSPGTESLFSEHAFAVYPIATQAVGATARVAPARDYGHDLEAMAALVTDRTRVVWIANPNNPTGTWLAADPLQAFIDVLPKTCVVVVDEAYTEYVDEPDFPDASRWLGAYPNLIVTRTFSKAHGLAALRVGYGLERPAGRGPAQPGAPALQRQQPGPGRGRGGHRRPRARRGPRWR